MTPFESMTGERLNVEHLKTFGCVATEQTQKGTDCMIVITPEFFTAEMSYLINQALKLRNIPSKQKHDL